MVENKLPFSRGHYYKPPTFGRVNYQFGKVRMNFLLNPLIEVFEMQLSIVLSFLCMLLTMN